MTSKILLGLLKKKQQEKGKIKPKRAAVFQMQWVIPLCDHSTRFLFSICTGSDLTGRPGYMTSHPFQPSSWSNLLQAAFQMPSPPHMHAVWGTPHPVTSWLLGTALKSTGAHTGQRELATQFMRLHQHLLSVKLGVFYNSVPVCWFMSGWD